MIVKYVPFRYEQRITVSTCSTISHLSLCRMEITKLPFKQNYSSPVMQSSQSWLNSTCTWALADGAHGAMNQRNTKAICHPETNSNYGFCYVPLVKAFVLLWSSRYGKHFNLPVWELKEYILMAEKILIPVLLTSFLDPISYVAICHAQWLV